jgi:two-component system, cell cycle sensor histidine kinase and response regulator CckA
MPRHARRAQALLAPLLLAVWLAALGWAALLVYRAIEESATEQLTAQQRSLAVEASLSIEDHFATLVRGLSLLAGDAHVIGLDDSGRRSLERFYALTSPELQSVTRMSAAGVILYTYPNVSSAGASIAAQTHVQKLLRTHQPVLSEVFTSVQGYRSLALHVPVFDRGVFAGSIAVLVPVSYIADHFLARLPIPGSGYAWVASREGIELYGPIPAYLGRDVAAAAGVSPSELTLLGRMTGGGAGSADVESDHALGTSGTAHVTYAPIEVVDTTWSIAIEAPRNEILFRMGGALRTWLPALILVSLGIIGSVLLLFVTELGRRERRSREIAEARYRSLVEQLPAVNYITVFGKPRGGETTYISPQIQTVLGFSPEEWMADQDLWIRQVHPDDRDGVLTTVRQSNSFGRPLEVEYRIFTKKGDLRWIHNRATYTLDEHARPSSMTGVMLDVTEKRLAIDALRESEESYRTLIDTAPFAVFVIDLTGKILLCNRQALVLGRVAGEEDLVGTNAFAHVDPKDAARAYRGILLTQENGTMRDVRFSLVRSDGTTFETEMNASLILGRDGAPRSILLVLQDISERLAAEHALRDRDEKLQQAQKLEAVGRLAGGVAHDFNNLLTVIRGYADSLVDAPDIPAVARQDIGEILTASLRAQSLTDQLLAYSRRQIRSPQVIDLNARVRHMEGMLRRLIGEHIALRADLDPDLPSVLADPGQMEQIIMNLAVNARDSMPQGGTLTLKTHTLAIVDENEEHPIVPPGRYVVFSMADSGIGMDDQTLARLFEPFFTTKELGKGTGLGLSTVYGIVKQSGGYIFVDSTIGQGSRFVIYLPACDESADSVGGPSPRAARARGAGRILLVEDEDAVRVLTRTMLARHGYSVLEARDGEEAIEACRALTGKLDLVITDVIMPGMGGIELGRRLVAMFPGLRVLYMSGYTDDEPGLREVLDDGAPFLRKPFNSAELVAMVHDVLGGAKVGPQGLEPWTNGL